MSISIIQQTKNYTNKYQRRKEGILGGYRVQEKEEVVCGEWLAYISHHKDTKTSSEYLVPY